MGAWLTCDNRMSAQQSVRLRDAIRSASGLSPCVRPPQKAWPCSRCDRSYTEYANYHKHQKQAHGSALPKTPKAPALGTTCQFCSGTFKSSRTLQYHIQTQHEDEMQAVPPFACSSWGDGFLNQRGLNSHRRRTHGL